MNVWFGSATEQDRNRLKWTIRTAERITGAELDLHMSRVWKQAVNISADPSHPGHNPFKLLPSPTDPLGQVRPSTISLLSNKDNQEHY